MTLNFVLTCDINTVFSQKRSERNDSVNFDPMRALMDRLTAWRIPGNAAIVCQEGKEVFSYQSGFADLEKKIPFSCDHLINLYSCSKPATVTAALQLYEKGLFLLDDPLYEFIPEFREMTVRAFDGSIKKANTPITLRHLFTMTSGLNYRTDVPALEKARAITGGKMDTLTVVKCLAQEPLDFEPGARWQYSLSHDVLAAVVEVVSGKRFSQYMQENIFDPLDMGQTRYHNEPVRDRMAQQYRWVDDRQADLVSLQSGAYRDDNGYVMNVGLDNHHAYGPEYDSGGAGIVSSVRDYVKFCNALACGGVGTTGERILAPGTIELLRTNQLNAQQLSCLTWSVLKGYGYGLGVRTTMDRAAAGYTGGQGEFGWGGAAGASVYMDPQRKVAMVYAHHMLNPQAPYYQPRVRNVLYTCLDD